MFWIYVLVIVVCLSLCAHLAINYSESMRMMNKIPGPRALPVIGNTLDMLTDRVSLFYLGRQWAKQHKDLYKFVAPGLRAINIYNPDDIEIILSTTKFDEKSIFYSFLKDWLGDGLLLSKGVKWHARRRILTPAFHFNILRHFSQVLEDNSRQMVRRLAPAADHDKTDIVPLVSMYALNSICETAMGTKLNETGVDAGTKYKKAIHEMGTLFLERFTKVWLINDKLFRLSSMYRAQKSVLETIKSFPRHVIKERKKYHEVHGNDMFLFKDESVHDIYMNKKKKMAMLDLLITAERDGLIDEDGIQEEVDTFMFEGHDTTSMGLVFALMLLANHREVQNKVFEECVRIFGDSDRPATMADLQELKYLECCVKESLRLYPPVPFIGRHIGEEVRLKNYTIPGGTICNIHIYDLHRRPDLFHLPEVFLPERFLVGSPVAALDSKHPYAYIPFSAGSRNCIGQKFAMLEMKSALSAVLRAFELRPVTTPEDVVFISDIVLRSFKPIYVQFVARI